jgi:DNA mismatch repair protein MutL
LPIGRFPIAVLSVKMDPTIIDVNVHPSKHEARLSKETELVQLVENELRKVIKAQRLIPEVDFQKKEQRQKETDIQSAFSFEYAQKKQENEPYQVHEPVKLETSIPSNSPVGVQETVQVNEMMDSFLDKKRNYTETVVEEREESTVKTESNQENIPVLYPIGQMHGTYILAQNENGLYLIDQHAAQERIKYEYFRKKVGMVERELQLLTVPYTFEYTTHEAAFISDHLDFLSQVGLFLELFGQNTFIVREHPQWFPKGYEKETIMDIIQQVLDHRKIDIEKLREEAAIMMSCKGSIKANHHLRNDEIFALLETLRKSEDPYTCPHGRPITIHLSTYELEKMFKRVM